MEQYEELLNRAYEKVKNISGSERFKTPTVETSVQGNYTIIRNFQAVCSAIRRDPKHVIKFLSKELAAPASMEGQVMLQGKFPQSVMQQKLEDYVKAFVICKECKRPDTKLVKEGRIITMLCEACGAKGSVKQI